MPVTKVVFIQRIYGPPRYRVLPSLSTHLLEVLVLMVVVALIARRAQRSAGSEFRWI